MNQPNQQKKVYYIGGGTCCGKSSVTDLLCKKYRFTSYKLDDYIEKYMKIMAERGNRLAKDVLSYSIEKMWMRNPKDMSKEQIQLYLDMFAHVKAAVHKCGGTGAVIAEGAGFLPQLMQRENIAHDRYICMIPSKGFQFDKYAQRSWVKHYLAATSAPDQAFKNWMERDALFSEQVRNDAEEIGYPTLVVDGAKTVEEIAAIVAKAFGL